MSWFERVTGTSESERQSWRDNYNGGRAAGDVTGNINRRIESERQASGGYTREYTSGSERVAAEWREVNAPLPVAPAARTAGPGSPAASTVQSPGGRRTPRAQAAGAGAPAAPTVGPGVQVVSGGAWGHSLAASLKDTNTQLAMGPIPHQPNPGWSDTEEWEARYGEPGDWLGGIVTMGVDLGYNAARWIGFDRERAARDIRSTAATLPEVVSNGAIDFARHLDTIGIQTRWNNSERAGTYNGQLTGWGTGGGF